MSIKGVIIEEIRLRYNLKSGDVRKLNLKDISRMGRMDYDGLRCWYIDPSRSMMDYNLDKILDVLGKRVILVDKDA